MWENTTNWTSYLICMTSVVVMSGSVVIVVSVDFGAAWACMFGGEAHVDLCGTMSHAPDKDEFGKLNRIGERVVKRFLSVVFVGLMVVGLPVFTMCVDGIS